MIHTKSKLYVQVPGDEYAPRSLRVARLVTGNNYPVCTLSAGAVGNGLENARRLSAAWNACEDITTDGLDAGVIKSAFNILQEMMAITERDTDCPFCGKETGLQLHDDDCIAARACIILHVAGME